MCLNSRELETRRIEVGDGAVIGMVNNYHGQKVKAAVPRNAVPGIVCYCIREGDELRLDRLSEQFMQNYDLVSSTATVIFREGILNRQPDQVEFDNGEVVQFSYLPKGVRLVCMAHEVPRREALIEDVVPIDPEPEPEPVLVRRGSVSAVLAGVVASLLH